MSRIRANKITNKLGTGAIELEKGAHLPIGMGITGAGGLNITGVVTAVAADIDDFLDVGSNIKLGNAGVITATSFIGSGAALTGIDATSIKDPGGNVKIQGQASGAVYTGIHTFTTLKSTSADFSGNVSIGGTLTYEDVINVDSVGIVTAREGIFIPDSKELKIGNTAGSPDLKLYHDGTYNWFNAAGGHPTIHESDGMWIARTVANENYIVATENDSVDLYFNGNKKFETSNTGVTVTGTVAATAYTGDGSALTGVVSGISTEALTTAGATVTLDLSKDDHKITKSGTYTITCTGGAEGEAHTLRIVNSGITTVGFSTYFLFPSGGTPSLPIASGAVSLISFTVHRAGAVGVSTQLLSGASINFS